MLDDYYQMYAEWMGRQYGLWGGPTGADWMQMRYGTGMSNEDWLHYSSQNSDPSYSAYAYQNRKLMDAVRSEINSIDYKINGVSQGRFRVQTAWVTVEPYKVFKGYNLIPVEVATNSGVTVYVETELPGHAYIKIGNTVYDYGEWNGGYGKDSFGPVGDGILLKFTGADADNYISTRSGKYKTVAHNVTGLDAGKMIDYYEGLMNSGSVISITDPATRMTNTGIRVDTYNLISNQCATKVTRALQIGGAPYIPANYSMAPLSLNSYLNALQLMNSTR